MLEGLAAWTDVLTDVRRAPHGVHALQCVLRYIYETSGGLSDRRIRAFLERVEEPALAEEIVTLAQMFENRGRKKGLQEGLQKGLEKGLQKGLQKGRAETLLRLLQKKFAKVPPRVATRVKAADEATLDRWLDQVLTAHTLAEALG